MQSSSAYVEMSESLELCGTGKSGTFAALKYVRLRLDLTIAEERAVDLDGRQVLHRRHMNSGADRHSAANEHVAYGPGLVHDVGNLLGALSLYADLLSLPGVLHEAHKEYASDLRLLSARSMEMVSRLVERSEQLNVPVEDGRTVLPDVLRRMRGVLGRIAGCRIEFCFDEGSTLPVPASREVVERVMTNLVKNAGESIDHSNGHVSIWVGGALRAGVQRVAVRVSDNGRGMNEAQLGALGGEAQRPGGRGIGFRVVRELVELSDGVMRISSSPGQGTMVELEWRVTPHSERTRSTAGGIGS